MAFMGRAVFLYLCFLAATTHSLVVPTQDTMVVSRSQDDHTEAATTVQGDDLTTEESVPPVKLTEMSVTSNIALRYAHTAVVTHVKNPAKKAQEATFRVLLPETAFISGFIMTLDGKSYKAYVKEKEEAKQIYDQAVSQGIGAAHVATKARDSNHFTVSVNVEPNTVAVFNLTYEELLVRRNGVYNHDINLHPGALVPKLTVTVNIKETEKISVLRVPEIRTGNEIDATAEDAQNPNAVIVRGHDDREATVTFTPDIEEQKKLVRIYLDKTKESHSGSNRGYAFTGNEPQTEGILGQFVVQYDVAHSREGEVLVNDGYFVHFFSPPDLPPLNKHVVFVLDTSGSMMDRKIVQLREAMQTILSDLNQGDYFSIVEFSSHVTVHELKEADEEPKKPSYNYYWMEDHKPAKLVAPSPATPENIAKAKAIISRLEAAGGTNIAEALDTAVELIRKGLNIEQTTSKATNDTQTASIPDSTTEVSETVTSEVETKNNTIKLVPIIIFLTDGDPTVGETIPSKIINRITEKNYGENKASIFSLAFGEDADRNFLRKISLRNEGFMRHIYEASDAALQLRDFYRQVSSPLLAHVKFVYPPDQVKENSLTKHKFRTFYAGSETVVAGRLEDSAAELTPKLEAFCGDGVGRGAGRKRYEVIPKVPVELKRDFYFPLERLWAYLTIKQLLDERDAQLDSEQPTNDDKENTPEKKALKIALKYELVTPLTSLVVVKPNATNAVNAESVDKVSDNRFMGLSGAPGIPLYSHFASAPVVRPAAVLPQYNSMAFGGEIGDVHLESADYEDGSQSLMPGASFMPMMHSYSMPGQMTAASFMPRVPVKSSSLWRHSSPFYPVSYSDPSLQPSPVSLPSVPPSYPAAEPPASTTRVAVTALQMYNLEEYQWASTLINGDSIVLPNTQPLKLTADLTLPQDADKDVECQNAVNGTAVGHCVYLTRCNSAKSISIEDYTKTFCYVNTLYAGVCCPTDSINRPRH